MDSATSSRSCPPTSPSRFGQNLTTEVQGGSRAGQRPCIDRVRQDYLEADTETLATALHEQVLQSWRSQQSRRRATRADAAPGRAASRRQRQIATTLKPRANPSRRGTQPRAARRIHRRARARREARCTGAPAAASVTHPATTTPALDPAEFTARTGTDPMTTNLTARLGPSRSKR